MWQLQMVGTLQTTTTAPNTETWNAYDIFSILFGLHPATLRVSFARRIPRKSQKNLCVRLGGRCHTILPPPIWIRNYISFYRPAARRKCGTRGGQAHAHTHTPHRQFPTSKMYVYHSHSSAGRAVSWHRKRNWNIVWWWVSVNLCSASFLLLLQPLLDDAHIKALQLRLSIYWSAIKERGALCTRKNRRQRNQLDYCSVGKTI